MSTKYKLIFLLQLLILLNLAPVSGEVVWQDDFTTDTGDWILTSYETPSYGHTYTEIEAGMIIANGMVTAPDHETYYPLQSHWAIHLSSVVYGNWSFDYLVPEDGLCNDLFQFIWKDLGTNPYNISGLNIYQFDWRAYWVVTESDVNKISLLKWLPNSDGDFFESLDTFELDITPGWHHIDITRISDGYMAIYWDKVKILDATDNEYTVSERFQFMSLIGNSSIDNIVVADWSTSEEGPLSFPLYILPVLITVVVLRKRKL